MPSSVMPTSSRGDGRPAPAAVSAVGLRKSYGEKLVLDGIDLSVPEGSCFRCSARTAPARPPR